MSFIYQKQKKIFGREVGTLKGRTTRRNPQVAREDNIEIPQELVQQHNDLAMYIDIMFVNGMPMLTIIDKPIRNRALVCLNNRTTDSIYSGLDKILRSYNTAGFNVKIIHSNLEFKSIM